MVEVVWKIYFLLQIMAQLFLFIYFFDLYIILDQISLKFLCLKFDILILTLPCHL